MSKKSNQSILTAQVTNLLDRMFKTSPLKDTILDGALEFYEQDHAVNQAVTALEEKDKQTYTKQVQAHSPASDRRRAEQEANSTHQQQQVRSARIARHERFDNLCLEILDLCEGESYEETNRKSAQLLGTVQLLTPTEGTGIAKINEQYKPLYKTVLMLRLLDRLIIDGAVKDAYIQEFLGEFSGEQFIQFARLDEEGYKRFRDQVKMPLMKASLIQDIGTYHPEAQQILFGPDGDSDPYRTLSVDDRKQLLQINYRESIKFLVDGLGAGEYFGNSKKDREIFHHQELRKLKFIKNILKQAINPKESLANVIKVPQIYCSIVLSTKQNYKYKLIPKVYQALYQNAERGVCSEKVVDSLYKITGMFPQGFGITYLALDDAGNSLERYEYAIVNQLYPEDPEEPICRVATRQLTFISHGGDILIRKSENLYFANSAKRLANMSRARLQEILENLVSNYQERADLDLIPRCWHPKEYFSIRNNQKLWNKAS
ncbi:hypothetical protein [Thalassotalea euphylliae]|uniref:Uncharacterized protein n=1 Tax=Thalassotalea euphylliae TaxID=1655234 RepID=A0A3E0UK45_9GAMM|nr:hypothetical protein [Thalassotalea euphylliae]REL37017.1 hypothetical protein DXX92_17800 [Thalassotalea euphylliae]